MFKLNTGIPLIVAAAIVCATPLTLAAALSGPEVNKIAKAVTVLIDGQAPGSGVILRREGNTYTVLTARHVVATPDEYEVVTPDGQRYKLNYSTVKPLPGVDLATLQFTSNQTYATAKLGNSGSVSEGTTVYVAGFPFKTAALTQSLYTFTRGEVTANASRPLADGYALVYSNSTLPGMSGGPVLDGQGAVIGIHGRADGQQEVRQTEAVYLKTGFNLGIPINTFLSLVAKAGTTPGLPTPPPSTPPGPTSKISASDLYLQGGEKFSQGDLRGAAIDFSEAIRLRPRYAEALSSRGLVYYRQANIISAIGDLNEAIKINPRLAEAYYNRGIIRVNSGRPGETAIGIKDLEQAALLYEQRGMQVDALRSRGVALASRNDHRGAIVAYGQALALDPSDLRTLINRGNARQEIKDYQGAIADYNEVIKLDPRSFVGFYSRGNAHLALGNTPSALVDFDRAISINPNYLDAYNNRGVLRAQTRNYGGAIADFNQVVRLEPLNPRGFNNRGMAKREQGDLRGALIDFDQAIRLDIRYARAFYNRGLVKGKLGDKPGATADLQQAVNLARSQGLMDVMREANIALQRL